jgi:hypothetical protein
MWEGEMGRIGGGLWLHLPGRAFVCLEEETIAGIAFVSRLYQELKSKQASNESLETTM